MLQSLVLILMFSLLPLPSAGQPAPASAPASAPATAPTSIPTTAPTSMPASMSQSAPVSAPATAPSAPFVVEDEDAALCLSEDLRIDAGARELACQRYLLKKTSAKIELAVRRRLLALQGNPEKTPETIPATDGDLEDYLDRLRHPRQKGDISLQLVAGLNTPNNTVGLQGGYYLSPTLQGGLSLGGGQTGVRTGLWGRGYLKDSRITPMASLALSFSPGRKGFAPQPSDTSPDGEEVLQVDFGPSALVHAGAGLSLRNFTGFSASAELGYALPLFEQSLINVREPQTPLPDPNAVRDGGIFLALSAGITF